MAVTIDTKKTKAKAEKQKKAETPPEERPADFDDYALPQVKQKGWQALGTWIGIMSVLCLPWWLKQEVYPFAYGMNLWWGLSTLAYLFLGPTFIVRRLRIEGGETEINDTTQPRLKGLIKRGSALLGISQPEGFIEKEGPAKTFPLPNAIIIRKGLFDLLTPDELNCLTVRDLVHIRQGHSRRLAMIHLFEATQPPIVKYLVWPVWMYSSLLKVIWLHSAQMECDRIAILLIKNSKLMVSAIVKEYAHNDANMQEMKVSTSDVSNWINQAGHIGMAGEEISTQYKLGRAIHEDPNLEERLQTLQKWADSAEFKVAVQKLAESQKKPG